MQPTTPDISHCLKLMEDFGMWENIRRHSFMVARVADILLREMQNSGLTPLPEREHVITGALLHDIAKTQCLQEDCRHAEVGAEICQDLGYPHIAEIVLSHVILLNFEKEKYEHGIFGATELVFYADKRVRHDEVVNLDARLEYILDKYALSNPEYERRIMLNFNLCRDLENHIFSRIQIEPDDIVELLASSPAELAHYPSEKTQQKGLRLKD